MGADPSRVRMSGPLVAYAGGFARDLAGRGYAQSTVTRHVLLMAHVSRWLEARNLAVSGLDPVAAGAFVAGRRAAGFSSGLTAGSLEPLLGYLRAGGAVPALPLPAQDLADQLLARYGAWLGRERGLAAATIERNTGLVRPFLDGLLADGCLDLGVLTAGQVSAFVVGQSRQRPGGVPRMATALRSFLRFAHADGLTAAGLAGAVPAAAAWKMAGLPKALSGGQVAALLASCDQGTAVGRRDYAVLVVLSRLGLRAGEAAGLRLDDIDWRRGEITVRGKGSRRDRLPLPADAGQAIVSYLTSGRPGSDHREVFLCARGPYRPMSRGAVTNVVASAARKAGLGTVHAHRLRHSAATAMLGAGAPLSEIGQLLRHRSALTTAIYAKVDISALRAVAQPWPLTEAAA